MDENYVDNGNAPEDQAQPEAFAASMHDETYVVSEPENEANAVESEDEDFRAETVNLSESYKGALSSQHDEAVVEEAKKALNQIRFDEDLALIKKEYPKEPADSVWELGEVFINLMASGEVDALSAYEAAKAHDKRSVSPVPPSTGSAANAAGIQKDFYTPEEVDRLTQDDFKNRSIFQRVRKSMLKW